MLQKSYLFLDTAALLLILGILASNRSKGAAGGMGQMAMNKTKKFEVTKNVKIKFPDVAGLH